MKRYLIGLLFMIFASMALAGDYFTVIQVSREGIVSEVQLYFYKNYHRHSRNITRKTLSLSKYTSFSISQAGELQYILLKIRHALLSCDERGNLALIEYDAGANIEYREGKIYRITDGKERDAVRFDYYRGNNYKTGKIYKIGSKEFRYYGGDDFRRGKIYRLGDLGIEYFQSEDARKGKIYKIGSVAIEYYRENRNPAGKIARVGAVSFEYDRYGRISLIGRKRFLYSNGRIESSQGSNGTRVIVEVR